MKEKKHFLKKYFFEENHFFLGTTLGNDDVTCKMVTSSKKKIGSYLTHTAAYLCKILLHVHQSFPRYGGGGGGHNVPPPPVLQSPKKPSTNRVKGRYFRGIFPQSLW